MTEATALMATVCVMKASLGQPALSWLVPVTARTRDTVKMEHVSVKRALLERTAHRVGRLWSRIKFKIYCIFIHTHPHTYGI